MYTDHSPGMTNTSPGMSMAAFGVVLVARLQEFGEFGEYEYDAKVSEETTVRHCTSR